MLLVALLAGANCRCCCCCSCSSCCSLISDGVCDNDSERTVLVICVRDDDDDDDMNGGGDDDVVDDNGECEGGGVRDGVSDVNELCTVFVVIGVFSSDNDGMSGAPTIAGDLLVLVISVRVMMGVQVVLVLLLL